MKWQQMYLPSKHHLLADLQMVPRRRPPSGRWPVRRIVPAFLRQTAALPGVREAICPTQAKHALLRLCLRPSQTQQAGVDKEKPG